MSKLKIISVLVIIALILGAVFAAVCLTGRDDGIPAESNAVNVPDTEEIQFVPDEPEESVSAADNNTEPEPAEENQPASDDADKTEIETSDVKITEVSDSTPDSTEEVPDSGEETEIPEPEPEPVYVPVEGISLSVYDVTITVSQRTMPWVTMSPANATNKGEIWASSDTGIATVDAYGNITGVSVGNCTVTVTSSANPQVFATVNVTVIPDAECTYIDGILIVNKTYPLPKSYAPGWDKEASDKLLEMFAAAKEDGLYFRVLSGYRSYIDQYVIYNDYVARDGQAAADRYSARPGHSEHQSGLAFDLNSLDQGFAETPEGIWLAENCHKYGFIIRYPKEKESITGYMYEPWHVRYLGAEKAAEVYESGLCLEEFLGITSEYSY